ncbi:tRNA 4-thiouridine(8) synthase ThiI [candidate division FCPU426 bacterium]|nr:tRNA 4-thiouridine(8) synthase ThiI [candidate division FCPU426 bacterium]
MRRAIVLYSGGLDSTLAIAMLQRAGVEVLPLIFITPFTNPLSKTGRLDKAAAVKQAFGMELLKMPLEDELLALIKNPHFGRGRHVNPCIDCHLLMLQKARELMPEVKADFVATGEVLGQRPMSQHKGALELIARKSGLGGLLLRPLSARLLAPTIPETEGWVAREYLLDIGGRGRKRQLALAGEMELPQYSSPAGGCLLTDSGYARKLTVLLEADMLTADNCRWIQFGRFFNLAPECKLVVARNEKECEKLWEEVRVGDVVIRPQNHKGPTAVFRGRISEASLRCAARIVAAYCRTGKEAILEVLDEKGGVLEQQAVSPESGEMISRLLIQ